MPQTTSFHEDQDLASPLLRAVKTRGGEPQKLCIDDMLQRHCGEFGVWQLRHFVLTSLAWALEAFHTMVMIFADQEPAWTCVSSRGCSVTSTSVCGLDPGSWEWSGGPGSSTAAEWGLVCENKYKVGLVQALFFGGCMIANMSNPIFSLLASQVLNGENFVKWKSNMNILLINENYHFVLKEDCPPVPPANASKAVSKEYNRWIITNNKTRCYLLAAMNEVLRTKHEGLETASEIMESLQQMFGRPSEQAHHEAMKVVMNSKMKNGSSVREHVLKMIHHFNEAEINGAKIDENTQVGMILETLSPSFLQFRTNYIMNHKKCNLTELLNELQSYETLINDKGGKENIAKANAVVGKVSSSRNKKKRNVRNQKDKKKIQKKKRKVVEPKPKGKCFHCNQDGHWKKNCKKYLDELKQKKKQDA